MKNGLAMDVVEFEPLNLGAVHQCSMRRGKPIPCSPDRTGPGYVQLIQRPLKDLTPGKISPIDCASHGVKHQ
jgi:hypothetical protein